MKVPDFYQSLYKKYSHELLNHLVAKCDKCNHQGHIIIENDMFIDCDCVKSFYTLKKYTYCGVNIKHLHRDEAWFEKEFEPKTFSKLNNIKANLDDALKVNFIIYPASDKHWGASHIGNQVLKYCVDAGKRCAVVSSKHIMDLFFSWDREDMNGCLEYLQNIDVLLIDEFGTEYNSKMKDNKSFVANNFNSLVMERKRLDKTTIIASNFHAKNIKETYASEIHSIITNNFVGLEIKSASRKKSEYEGILVKIQKPELRDCFEDIDMVQNKKKGCF